MEKKTPGLLPKYLSGCDRATSYEKAKDDIKYAYVSTLWYLLVMLVIIVIFMLFVGFQKALKTIFYVVSFHWLIKQIADSKDGEGVKVKFKRTI